PADLTARYHQAMTRFTNALERAFAVTTDPITKDEKLALGEVLFHHIRERPIEESYVRPTNFAPIGQCFSGAGLPRLENWLHYCCCGAAVIPSDLSGETFLTLLRYYFRGEVAPLAEQVCDRCGLARPSRGRSFPDAQPIYPACPHCSEPNSTGILGISHRWG